MLAPQFVFSLRVWIGAIWRFLALEESDGRFILMLIIAWATTLGGLSFSIALNLVYYKWLFSA